MMLSRLFAGRHRKAREENVRPHAVPGFRCCLGNIEIIEVSDATSLAGDLFLRAFRENIPDFPRHFVIIRKAEGAITCIGYVHYKAFEGAYLAGGLVVAAMQFRRLDATTMNLVRGRGGLAEWLMRSTCEYLAADGSPIFAYMGDSKSITVNQRVGFKATKHRFLYALWNEDFPSASQSAVIERVNAIGPF